MYPPGVSAEPNDALLEPPVPAPLGEGTPASPRLVVDTWLAVPGVPGAGSPAWRVLLLLRQPDQGGFWQGVSGRVEAVDASLAAAARREIQEETGYVEGVRVFDLGRWVEFTSPWSGRTFRKRSLGAVLPAHAGPSTVRLSDEHAEARLVGFEEARALVRFPENREELDALEAHVVGLAPRAVE